MIPEALTALALIGTSFAATNLDNLALLVSWLLGDASRPRSVFLGHLLGMLVLLALSMAFGMGVEVVPSRFVGYLGLIPIGLGLRGVYRLLRARSGKGEPTAGGSPGGLPLAIAATQVANGVDTVLVFGPLLADSELGIDLAMVVGFVGMAVLWFGLALGLRSHASRLGLVERFGPWVAPFVLIVVGLYILDNTATDVLPGD